ncbi:MAG: hypothetical protein ACOVQ7_19755 [Limnoraphis robusta]
MNFQDFSPIINSEYIQSARAELDEIRNTLSEVERSPISMTEPERGSYKPGNSTGDWKKRSPSWVFGDSE